MSWLKHWKEYSRLQKVKLAGKLAAILCAAMAVCLTGVLLLAKWMGPPPLLVPQTTVIHSSSGEEIGEISNSGQKRTWVPLNKMSPALIEATLSIEDKNFYEHHGFDFKRIAAALLADLRAGAKVQGASTITQQFARNLFLTHEKTWLRKGMEAFYTIRLEMNYSKNQILEGYLNTIYYGHGTYGIQSASAFYFGKDASHLSISEAAMLAGVPKGPGYYSPLYHEDRAKERQAIILKAMENNRYLSKKEVQEAAAAPLTIVAEKEVQKPKIAPYFQAEVMKVLKKELKMDPKQIELGGLHIYTTLDVSMQTAAEKEIEERIDPDSSIQTALVSMDPRNGDVKALVGGRNYAESPFDRAIQAKRAPGSTFKPFLYYTALKNGYTPSTAIKSEPTSFAMGDGQQDYEPKNYNNLYAYDFITLSEALALSDNIYAVKTNLFLGPKKLVKAARQFGIKSPLASVPSLALGTKNVSVMEMTNAYNLFANGGKRVEPVFIKEITDNKGRVLYEHHYKQKQVLDKKAAFVMTDLMKGMFDEKLNDYAKVTGASIDQYLTRPAAGKSGSTPTDSWMVGFTPQLTTGVWIGYDQGKEINRINDGSYSKKIWVHYMEDALKDEPAMAFKKPKGVVGVMVNPKNGKLATKNCPIKRKTYYIKGTEPTEYCNEHAGDLPMGSDGLDHKRKGWFQKVFPWWH
ncbi:monofunctional biosynthetic peptidoglycan transglycosylase [Fictibacillus enclensis]|uniref:Monofunctional biosynthetic peptidoglycan transglycosylase n=1 Tax=Fictibacillus enclensis TaxID=1017270 RepID=A0A0V8J533_9BACL|nr:PBP1A family penicillin-binding protein [Fictibacillus enclensis]KSU81792.1 monofunctional biosynthetic peptidoglycan transglycosylase [Fictibacillus enclensis]SCC26164.1 monofunctional biosynthetic peptidoglycan transglycosylase [Fictibacillus enclensis]